MIGKKILEERYVSLSEAKDILEKRSKSGELNYEQKTTLDYLNKFAKIAPEDTKKLIEELVAKSDKIKPEVAVKIADLLPQEDEDVRAIFAKQRFTLTKDEIGKILSAVPKK